MIFSNPCNPTGQGYDRKSVLQFVLSTDALCIIDEAYMDFWDQSILADAPWLENAFVLRTLSKVFGAAALRLGFAVANAKLTAALRTAKSPYNVNAVSQAFGKLLLERRDADRQRRAGGGGAQTAEGTAALFPRHFGNGYQLCVYRNAAGVRNRRLSGLARDRRAGVPERAAHHGGQQRGERRAARGAAGLFCKIKE